MQLVLFSNLKPWPGFLCVVSFFVRSDSILPGHLSRVWQPSSYTQAAHTQILSSGGGGADTESINPGVVECIEVEEEEDVNDDVKRCLLNGFDEGGFMIQVIIQIQYLFND